MALTKLNQSDLIKAVGKSLGEGAKNISMGGNIWVSVDSITPGTQILVHGQIAYDTKINGNKTRISGLAVTVNGETDTDGKPVIKLLSIMTKVPKVQGRDVFTANGTAEETVKNGPNAGSKKKVLVLA